GALIYSLMSTSFSPCGGPYNVEGRWARGIIEGAGADRYSVAMETPAIQDYLAAIYDLAGSEKPVIGARLARHMKLSPPSITEALRRMQREGYIKLTPKHEIRLTPKGFSIAETMARRHRLIERWLTDVLGLDWAGAHDEAHRLEHAISPVVEESLATILGMPSTCPHSNPIPGIPQPTELDPIPPSHAPARPTYAV